MRPLVLLSNDDGYRASGLRALLRALTVAGADVVVCAPESNQSATSHSLSLHRVLRLRAVDTHVFAVDGTPADCVYVALHSLRPGGRVHVLERRPDLVVSGMNHGPNLGLDVFYSGTIAAAREAALRGIPAVAVSATDGADRDAAAAIGAAVAMSALRLRASDHSAPTDPDSARAAVLLNVNIPDGSGWTVRSTRLGSRNYDEEVVYRTDPRGREYLWIGGGVARHDPAPGSDTEAFDDGVVSVTPLTLDLFEARQERFAAAVVEAIERSELAEQSLRGEREGGGALLASGSEELGRAPRAVSTGAPERATTDDEGTS